MVTKVLKTCTCQQCGKEFEIYIAKPLIPKYCSKYCMLTATKDLKLARSMACRALKDFFKLRDVIRKLEKKNDE